MLTEWYYIREALVDIRDNFILRVPNVTITKPTSAQANRGGVVREEGGTGVADKLYFSRKDAADAHAWVDLLGLGDAGPSSSVDSEVALFSGTTGKVLKRATGTGIAKITSGVLGTDAALTDLAGKWTAASSSGPAVLRFSEDTDNGSNYVDVTAPANLTGNRTQTLQDADGTIALLADRGMALLASSGYSVVSSVSINNCFSADYENYLIIVGPHGQSAGANLNFRVRASGTDLSSAIYYYAWQASIMTGTVSNTGSGTQSLIVLIPSATQVTDSHTHIWVTNPFASNETIVSWRTVVRTLGPSGFALHGGGYANNTTSYDGFSLIASSGTMTGNVRVYGVRD